jgi:hypothetical protein
VHADTPPLPRWPLQGALTVAFPPSYGIGYEAGAAAAVPAAAGGPADADVAALQSRVASLQARNRELAARDEELEARNKETELRNKELEARKQELEARGQDLQSRVTELEAHNKELLQQLRAVRARSSCASAPL